MQTPRPKTLDASDIVFETVNVTPDEVAAVSAVIVAAAAEQRPGSTGGERDDWDLRRTLPPVTGRRGWKRSLFPL